MLFRVLDIETVPDLTMWTQGEPKWVQKPLIVLEAPSTGTFGVCKGDSQWVKEEPFPPPQAHRVVAISWLDIDTPTPQFKEPRVYRFCDLQAICDWSGDLLDTELVNSRERGLLYEFSLAQIEKPATLVSWNGRTFDLPVMTMRAFKHGVSWSWFYKSSGTRYRYSEEGHIDLMDFLSDYGAGKSMKLTDAAHLMGLPGKTDMSGDKVADVVAGGRKQESLDKIARYCSQDVIQTSLLFLRSRLHVGNIDVEGYKASLETFEKSEIINQAIEIAWDNLRLGIK